MEPEIPKLILVPTDFSPPSGQALRYGAALAERFGAHLLVIYADSFTPAIDFTAGAAGVFDAARDQLVDTAREQLQRYAEDYIPATVPFDVRVMVGNPPDAIVNLASESGASLIVMGTHGRTGLRRLIAGSVAEAVMRFAPVPVIVVRELARQSTEARRIAGYITPTRECRQALRYAATLAADSAIYVLFGTNDVAARPFTAQDLELLEVCTPRELIGRASFATVAPHDPATALAAATADQGDLIVLGIAEDRTLGEALRGTVAEQIVRQSACPVLTVNHFAAGRWAARAAGAERDVRAAVLA